LRSRIQEEVNDTYGHHIGDEVLKAVAEKCQETIRKTDFLGRIGGEEFAIGMPNIDRDGALVIAERLREEIAGLEIRGEFERTITPTISVGVAEVQADDRSLERMMVRADKKMYAAKDAGRDQVVA